MQKSTSAMWLGALSLLLGLMALFNPVKFTWTAEIMASWSLAFVGAGQLVSAFSNGVKSLRWGLAASGALTLWLGLYLMFRPVIGALTLTVIVAVFLLSQGIAKVALAFRFKKTPAFWMILLSAVVSLALAFMIFNNLPQSALTLLGVFLGVELIALGVNLLAMGKVLKTAQS
jgi:uncharacterized membrane protein HdeD (DUF308 family)